MTSGIYCVIVTYNPMKWVDELYLFLKAENILSNTIFIDNGSTDGFPLWIEQNKLSDNVYFQNINLGFGAANNLGIKLALKKNAKYILLLNQDAWLEKGSLDVLIDVLSRNRQIGIVSPLHFQKNLKELDSNFKDYLRSSDLIAYFQNSHKLFSSGIDTAFVNAAIWLLSTDTIKIVGGFNPSFYHYGEDDEYCNRLKKRGFKIAIVPSAIGVHDRGNRIQQFDRAKSILQGTNIAKIYFFKTESKYPLLRTVIKIIINKGCLKLNLKLRIIICFNLVLERKILLINKRIAELNNTPFLES